MQTILEELKILFAQALPEVTPEIVSSSHADYQYNSAMKAAKLLGKNPRQIAEELKSKLESAPLIDHLEVAGPGFINIFLKTSYLEERLLHQLSDPKLGVAPPVRPERIIVEFSSPNTAKEMHVGHLRSTIIGDALARLFEFLGNDVLRLNHVGDWGTAFGMLIAYMKQCVHTSTEEAHLQDLVSWYKAAKLLFDQDERFKRHAQLEVVKLQGGDAHSLKEWEKICAISRKSYQEIYDILDIHLIERGESYYNPVLAPLVKELEEKGMVTISNGAKCIFIEGFKNKEGEMLPLMIQKSDGGYNYDTTDMAAIRQRVLEEKAERILYVVDAGQSTHFQLVFEAAKQAGYLTAATRAEHVPFGLVLGSDGKKFKTRSGESVRLIDLLTTAEGHALNLLKEKGIDLPQEALEELAHVLGINAVKYADLSCLRTHDYTFSFERMLRFEGNTAAFLMYAYVRVLGIKRKVGKQIEELKGEKIALKHPSERALGLHLLRFPEELYQMAEDLFPHRLADFLYHLAEKFHAFFRDCKVYGDPFEASRLLLAELTAKTLKQGMHILGLKTVEWM